MNNESNDRRESDPLGQSGMYLADHLAQAPTPPPTSAPRPTPTPTGPASYDPFAFPPPTPVAASPVASPQAAPYPVPFPVAPPVLGAPRSDKNWKGIVSVVLGALGGGLLGLAFGLSGMSDAKKGLATNRTMAMWGVILNIAVPVLAIGAIAIGSLVTSALDGDRILATDVAVGECIARPGMDDAGTLTSEYVKRVPCTEEHWGQVYARDYYRGATFPGSADMERAVDELCNAPASVAHLDSTVADEWYYVSLMPTGESFALGDRRLVCLVSDADESLVGDLVVD